MKQKMDSIQALRAAACLTVFLNHCYVDNVGVLGVSVFFVMSGFLMTFRHLDFESEFSLSPGQCLRFSWGRIKKLYPLYIITLLPILLLNIAEMLPSCSGAGLLNIFRQLAVSLLLIQSWFPDHCMAFNGVAWYLSTAFFLYFCFPYINRCISRYRKTGFAWIAIALLLVLEAALSFLTPYLGRLFPFLLPSDPEASFALWFTYIFPPFRLIDFALGCNAGFLFLRRNVPEKKAVTAPVDVLTLALFALSITVYRLVDKLPGSDCYKYTLLFSPFSILCTYCFALNRGFLSKLITNRFTVYLGDLSSSFYLIHQDVIRFLTMALSYAGLSLTGVRIAIIPLAFALTVLLSIAYKKLAESRRKIKV